MCPARVSVCRWYDRREGDCRGESPGASNHRAVVWKDAGGSSVRPRRVGGLRQGGRPPSPPIALGDVWVPCPRAGQGRGGLCPPWGPHRPLLVAPAPGLAHLGGAVGAEKCPVRTPGCWLCWEGPRRWPRWSVCIQDSAPGEDTSCPALWASPGRVRILRAGAAHPVKTEFLCPLGAGPGARCWVGDMEPSPHSSEGLALQGAASLVPARGTRLRKTALPPVPSGANVKPSQPLELLPGPGGSRQVWSMREGGRWGAGTAPRRDQGAAALSRVSSPPGAAPRGPGRCAVSCQPPWPLRGVSVGREHRCGGHLPGAGSPTSSLEF